MSDDNKGSIKDVDSLSKKEKAELIKNSFIAVTDIAQKKGKSRKTEVAMGVIDGIKLSVVGIDESIKRKPRSKPKDRVSTKDSEIKIIEKLVPEVKDDFNKTNLIVEISKLDLISQQEIAKILIDNKNDWNIKNTEDTSLVSLQNESTKKYSTGDWYFELLQTIIKLSQQACVNKENIEELSDEQDSHLTGSTKNLILILENLLELRNPDQV